jgi:hypothetical protein
MYYAHFFTSRGHHYILITDQPSCLNPLFLIEVGGKVDARKRAALYGATPWNF